MYGNWTTDGRLVLSWDDVFSSDVDSPLVFEVSVGTRVGASNILQWFETEKTYYSLSASQTDRQVTYHVTTTAINRAGLHTTIAGTV